MPELFGNKGFFKIQNNWRTSTRKFDFEKYSFFGKSEQKKAFFKIGIFRPIGAKDNYILFFKIGKIRTTQTEKRNFEKWLFFGESEHKRRFFKI